MKPSQPFLMLTRKWQPSEAPVEAAVVAAIVVVAVDVAEEPHRVRVKVVVVLAGVLVILMAPQSHPVACTIGGANRVTFAPILSTARGRISSRQNLETNETVTSSTAAVNI